MQGDPGPNQARKRAALIITMREDPYAPDPGRSRNEWKKADLLAADIAADIKIPDKQTTTGTHN